MSESDNQQRPTMSDRIVLQLCPITFAEACAFVDTHHRHHLAPVGHKFSVAVAATDCDGGSFRNSRIVGVAMVGRPVARHMDDGLTLEVNRTCTDGTANVNSMLYAAAWKAARNMGYRRLITYTRSDESGSSLKAAGWKVVAQRPPTKGWSVPSRPRVDKTEYGIQRTLWEA